MNRQGDVRQGEEEAGHPMDIVEKSRRLKKYEASDAVCFSQDRKGVG